MNLFILAPTQFWPSHFLYQVTGYVLQYYGDKFKVPSMGRQHLELK